MLFRTLVVSTLTCYIRESPAVSDMLSHSTFKRLVLLHYSEQDKTWRFVPPPGWRLGLTSTASMLSFPLETPPNAESIYYELLEGDGAKDGEVNTWQCWGKYWPGSRCLSNCVLTSKVVRWCKSPEVTNCPQMDKTPHIFTHRQAIKCAIG